MAQFNYYLMCPDLDAPPIVIPAKAGIQTGWTSEGGAPFDPIEFLDSRLRRNDEERAGMTSEEVRDLYPALSSIFGRDIMKR